MTSLYCGHCGEPRPTESTPLPAHARCDAALRLEPPRYCTACRRRMVVQVAPTGWTARCSRHGEVAGAHR